MFGSHFYSILEALQYGFLYFVAAFLGGVGLDFAFPKFKKDTPTDELLREVVGQSLALIVVVFLIRLSIQRVPIWFPMPRKGSYIPYESSEFNGEMMMGFVFLGCQLNLINKIDLIADKIYKWYFKEERTALTAVEIGLNNEEKQISKLEDTLKQGVIKRD